MVSVVLTTYNRPELLIRALESVKVQTFQPKEIILVDDASDKNTTNFIKKHLSDDIIYIRHERNLGLAAARNSGLYHAKGDFIAFLDDDVVLDPNYYEEIEKVFLEHPDALGVHGYNKLVNKAYQEMKKSFFKNLMDKFIKFFMIYTYYEDNKSRVLPSLCVTILLPLVLIQ